MTRPGLFSSVLGFPPVTFTLLAMYAYVFWQWYGGHMPFLFALVAFFAAGKTIRAYDKKREYDDQERLQQALLEGVPYVAAKQWPRHVAKVVRALLACLVLGTAAAYQHQLPQGDFRILLGGVKWAALIYLGNMLVRMVIAWFRREPKPQACAAVPAVCEPQPHFVTWTLPVPTESPTREWAEQQLPDYCAGLIQRRGLTRI